VQNPESPGFIHKVGVVVFSLKKMMPTQVAKELALRSGIGVRYGCHCAHIMIKHLLGVSPFLERFQRLIVKLFPKLRLPGLVRVSLGIENTQEEIIKLIKVLTEISGKNDVSNERPASSPNKDTPTISRKESGKE
jgi:selenocysteine lyase/cysteine desulfurase